MEKKIDYLEKVKQDSKEMFEKSVKEISDMEARDAKKKARERSKETKRQPRNK